MYATPFKFYLAIWLPGLFAPQILSGELYEPLSFATTALVITPGLVYLIFGAWNLMERFHAPVKSRLRSPAVSVLQEVDLRKAIRVLVLLLWVWVIAYASMIIFSGGLPFFWFLLGDSRTYVDFGIPTIGGLCNMLRALIVSLAFMLISHQEARTRLKRRLKIMIYFMLFSAFILESSRGAGVVLALHLLAFFFVGRNLKAFTLIKVLVLTSVFMVCLGYVQHLRYGADWEETRAYARNQGLESFDGKILPLLAPIVVYVVSPAQNLELNVSHSSAFSFSPNFTLQGLVPSILRNEIYEQRDYGPLVSEANNTSTSYTPLVRDFGVIGAAVIGSLMAFLTGGIWLQASRGKLVYALVWPPFFMALVLSFFHLYLTSLIVVLYVPLAIFISKTIQVKGKHPGWGH